LVRALMELDGASAEAAAATVAGYEAQDLTVRELYAQLEGRLDGRLLVDKTPSYALDPAVLARAEDDFEVPLYLHLLRHPQGMIRSFVQAKLDQVFFRPPHAYPRRELAELIWLASQRNILAHLATVPAERQLTLRFEDLVRQPEAALRRVSAFLGLDFDPAMLDPYSEGGRRMTDGVHALSKMLGDVRFHEHRAVDPTVAERWRESPEEVPLGEATVALAESFGYSFEPPAATGEAARLAIPRRPAGSEPLPLSHSQERLWFIDQLQPSSAAYNLPAAIRLRGALDVPAFHAALAEVVRRHEALRTTFAFSTEEARPVQRIAPWQVPDLPRIDVRALPPSRGRPKSSGSPRPRRAGRSTS
jgi:hypothetical protein